MLYKKLDNAQSLNSHKDSFVVQKRKCAVERRNRFLPKDDRARLEDLIEFVNNDLFSFLDCIDPFKWQIENILTYCKLAHTVRSKSKPFIQALILLDMELYKDIILPLKLIDQELSKEMPLDKDGWFTLLHRLIPLYVQLTATISLHCPRTKMRNLRYTNYSRSILHALTAISIILLVEYILTKSMAIYVSTGATLLFWISEVMKNYSKTFRKIVVWAFGQVAREHEYNQVNSATWYTSALAILAIVFPNGPYSMIGVIILGIGDPVAAFVGKRYGTHRFKGGKSLEGFIGFVMSSCIGSVLYLSFFHPWTSIWLLSFSASLFGGLAEFFSSEVDDNFTIPLVAATSAWIANSVHQLP